MERCFNSLEDILAEYSQSQDGIVSVAKQNDTVSLYKVSTTENVKFIYAYYCARYIAKSILRSEKTTKYSHRKEMISDQSAPLSVDIPEKECSAEISREGLRGGVGVPWGSITLFS